MRRSGSLPGGGGMRRSGSLPGGGGVRRSGSLRAVAAYGVRSCRLCAFAPRFLVVRRSSGVSCSGGAFRQAGFAGCARSPLASSSFVAHRAFRARAVIRQAPQASPACALRAYRPLSLLSPRCSLLRARLRPCCLQPAALCACRPLSLLSPRCSLLRARLRPRAFAALHRPAGTPHAFAALHRPSLRPTATCLHKYTRINIQIECINIHA